MMITNTEVLVEEIEQLRHELANTKKLLTLQESINHLLEQHIASQDTVIQAARKVMACEHYHGHLQTAIIALDHASS
jgi:septal ring factor EnvC (AmiA/AmiB activator)